MSRGLAAALAVALVVVACGEASTSPDDIPVIPEVTPAAFGAELAASTAPVVVNVWASWCAPCRSEAPLLRTAAAEWGEQVRFIGIDVRDTQDEGRAFIAEFGLTALDHRFDPSGAVPRELGGVGVPLTYFFHPGGDLAHVHHGVIDERTLALWIDVIAGAG